MPFCSVKETLSDEDVDEKGLQVEDEGLLHEDEVVISHAEGVVVGRPHLPLARDGAHQARLLH